MTFNWVSINIIISCYLRRNYGFPENHKLFCYYFIYQPVILVASFIISILRSNIKINKACCPAFNGNLNHVTSFVINMFSSIPLALKPIYLCLSPILQDPLSRPEISRFCLFALFFVSAACWSTNVSTYSFSFVVLIIFSDVTPTTHGSVVDGYIYVQSYFSYWFWFVKYQLSLFIRLDLGFLSRMFFIAITYDIPV